MIFHPLKHPGRRYVNIVFFVSGALVISLVLQYAVLWYYERNWDRLEEARARGYLQEAASRFTTAQRETRRVTTDLARKSAIISFLERRSTDLAGVFREAAEATERSDAGVEVYNGEGTLVAWDGLSGPVDRTEIARALKGHLTSYVIPSGIASQLFVVTPVWSGDHVVGAVLVRSILDMNYPLNNKYVEPRGLSESVNRDLGISVEFDFSRRDEAHETRKGDYYRSTPLYGIDSTRIGLVGVVRPSLAGTESEINRGFRLVQVVLVLFLLGIVLIPLWRGIRKIRNRLLLGCTATALIWSIRYLLLWIGFPSMFFSGGISDPIYYASTFGGGLAKSIAELSVTSIALLLNTLIAGRLVLTRVASGLERRRAPAFLRWPAGILISVFLFLLLRGFGAVLRSAVFDSSLLYTDPTVVIPSFPLAAMVINLFTITLSFVLVCTGSIFGIFLLVSGRPEVAGSSLRPWLLTTAVLVAVAFLSATFIHPLTDVGYRLMFVISLVAFTYVVRRKLVGELPWATPASFLLPLGFAALLLYPQLDARISERDHQRIQAFGAEFLRPVDTWLTSVVDQALQDFREEEVLNTIRRGSPEEVNRLALSVWSKSAACREGYSSLFLVTDSAGHPVSRFSIGNRSLLPEQSVVNRLPLTQTVQMREVGTGVNAFKVYRGATPLRTPDGLAGYAFVLIAAGQQTLFRGELPVFLRSPAPESLEAFYRPVTVAEFRNGKLYGATDDIFPGSFAIPAEAERLFRADGPGSFWSEVTVGSNRYEAFFLRGNREDAQVIVLCLPAQGIYWHFFSLVKFLVYYILVALVVLAAYLLFRWIRGTPYRLTFRDRLLAALFLTAVVPLAVIAYYGKDFAERRLTEETSDRLQRETEVIALQVLEKGDKTLNLSADAAEEVAGEVGTDFNIYVGTQLDVTSRPELYAAGLLDRRLSGSAYAAVVLAGERFFQQTEKVGRYRYSVGYRPVYDRDENILGIVSVPTIYRQDELDRQVSQQNAFLFSVYAIVFLAIVVVASTVAGRIAWPIHRLTLATRRVSEGDLDVSVRDVQADGEIGELIKSFEAMTRNLKRQREELIRFERDLAWKEMAKQVAHEIKNPLTPMKLSLQHLRQLSRDRAEDFNRILDDIIGTVIEQIDTLSRIASEFSRFAKMPDALPEPCDVNSVARESLRLFEQEKDIEFVAGFDEPGSYVLADREELRRAFINIVRNGIQAMNGRGRFDIQTTKENGRVVVVFRDSGTGIAEEMKKKLFQPNFSTKSEGMGLGLAIVKKTIDDLGGTIEIDSVLGRGTVVRISLPLFKGGDD